MPNLGPYGTGMRTMDVRRHLGARRRISGLLLCVLTAGLLLLPAAAGASDDMFNISLGFDYSTGEYGGPTTTEILYVPVSIMYERGSITLRGTVPYLRINNAGNVIGGGSDVIATGEQVEEEGTESGLGDINLSASYFLYGGSETLPMLDVTAKLKLPTADEEKGLGTGAADLTIEADLTKMFDRSFIYLTAGYKFYGDPKEVELNNVLLGSLGLGHRFTDKATAGLIYDARQASTPQGSAMSEATAYLSYRLTGRFRLMTYLLTGFSDGSPDLGIGLSLATIFAMEDLTRIIPSIMAPRR
jgi:hypothetical protein